jgi:hypothetical protein
VRRSASPLLGEGEIRAGASISPHPNPPRDSSTCVANQPCPHHHTEECVVCWRRSLFSPAARLQAQSSSARRSGASVSTLTRLFARTHTSHWASSASFKRSPARTHHSLQLCSPARDRTVQMGHFAKEEWRAAHICFFYVQSRHQPLSAAIHSTVPPAVRL